MRLFRIGLRFWITLTSVFSFIAGWILLAHSPKPVQAKTTSPSPAVNVAPLPTLQPLSPLNFSSSNSNGGFQSQNFSVQPAPQVQSPSFFAQAPAFTTGGS